ncbi:3-isopropylmalate dehydratase small subunit [Evansella sp. LMS18]|uniref:3-isopropylmalate dehydratase small subunit n=1 Tax=Evansella sp. LMS18 TaxID=2924033 RepID=UPI0020D05606|nr:3-isopropylmalate dehydratase small subunit [Evansella sp. LMS18]UTR10262.1 3-isopropylmalate dehydratase small subunit [Evansella sp. LMS18]
MKPFSIHKGTVAPLKRANIDTGAILPKQYLKRVEKKGFGQFLFHNWRFLDNGEDNPDFVLNQHPYREASILLTLQNFGCGSSREHAPWALEDFGFRVLIAPSFADIFYNNCFKNGILPIELPHNLVNELFEIESNVSIFHLEIDLEKQMITDEKGFTAEFNVNPFRKEMLLKGWDDISITLKDANAIEEYESTHQVFYNLNTYSEK